MTGTAEEADLTGLDAEVHERVVAGRHRDAADLLIGRLSGELRSFLYRLLGDPAPAEEAHSATCERLRRGLPTFNWEYSVRAWGYIVASREASRCRTRYARERFQQTTSSNAEGVAAQIASTSRMVSTITRDQFEIMRASLSVEDRDLLVLRVESGLGWKEIAVAFLQEDDSDPDAIGREAARLRQRFRAIRIKVAAVIPERPKP